VDKMKLFYTEQAIESLRECLDFLPPEVPHEKRLHIRDKILAKAEMLVNKPGMGQKEEYLEHLGLSHRRVIESHYKIIYRIEGEIIYVTDIFDSRQDPAKMKG
jgi:toxin ParE1/3/4